MKRCTIFTPEEERLNTIIFWVFLLIFFILYVIFMGGLLYSATITVTVFLLYLCFSSASLVILFFSLDSLGTRFGRVYHRAILNNHIKDKETKKLVDMLQDRNMNPGKIIDPTKMDDPATLRYTPAYEIIPLQTRFDWESDGGWSGAVEMCNGAGVCRKEGTGTMCPSYMGTRDEAHSTRGRANALRMAMSGKLPDGMADESLKAVYDLCLACKACSAECPSSVDVAKMKSEFLAQYHVFFSTTGPKRLTP